MAHFNPSPQSTIRTVSRAASITMPPNNAVRVLEPTPSCHVEVPDNATVGKSKSPTSPSNYTQLESTTQHQALEANERSCMHRLELIAVQARNQRRQEAVEATTEQAAAPATAVGSYCANCAQVSPGDSAIGHIYWDEIEMKKHGWLDAGCHRCGASKAPPVKCDSLNRADVSTKAAHHTTVAPLASDERLIRFGTDPIVNLTASSSGSVVQMTSASTEGNIDDMLERRCKAKTHDAQCTLLKGNDVALIDTARLCDGESRLSTAAINCVQCSRDWHASFMRNAHSAVYVEHTPTHRSLVITRPGLPSRDTDTHL